MYIVKRPWALERHYINTFYYYYYIYEIKDHLSDIKKDTLMYPNTFKYTL